jgi:hypothetical protein
VRLGCCSLSLRERVGVREVTQHGTRLIGGYVRSRPGSALAASLTPTLSRRERGKAAFAL